MLLMRQYNINICARYQNNKNETATTSHFFLSLDINRDNDIFHRFAFRSFNLIVLIIFLLDFCVCFFSLDHFMFLFISQKYGFISFDRVPLIRGFLSSCLPIYRREMTRLV